ncbi:mobilization protein [Sphingomonas sp.]|uniref:mobilization protein n=1 Tax=Sphingomonas sp. TaxID=28214 RepID=UPI0028A82AA3|nr:mobilization protein [Sphingomonas sp.]
MVDPKPSKIEKLKERQKQLAAQIAAAEARERNAERTLDTRRKILIGSAVMESMRRGEYPQDQLAVLLNRFLVHDRDRKLFDFLPDTKPEPNA